MLPWLRRFLPALGLLTIAAAPVPSFDCAKTGSAVDRPICADAASPGWTVNWANGTAR